MNRPKGLCWTCYYTPGVKDAYPAVSAYGVRGVGIGDSDSPLPSVVTTARPGSEEKIAVMRQRAERGEALCHPGDGDQSDPLGKIMLSGNGSGTRRLSFVGMDARSWKADPGESLKYGDSE